MTTEATQFLGELVPAGAEVRLDFDVVRTDRYGRTLAYVWLTSTGLFVNGELVRQGFARPLTIPPNVAHTEEFVVLASEARRTARGLWGACSVAA